MTRCALWLLLALALAACARSGAAATTNAELVGQVGGQVLSVATDGAYAYAGVGPRLVVYDASDPAAPHPVGETPPLPGLVRDVALAGSLVYLAVAPAELRVVDVSTPSAPREVGRLALGGPEPRVPNAASLHVFGSRVVVTGSHTWLIDVADPTRPTLLRQSETFGTDVVVVGRHAYVASGGIVILDVADPAVLRRDGVYPSTGSSQIATVATDGARIYAGETLQLDRPAGLRILDLADPIRPSPLGFVQTPGNPADVAVAGTRAYVAETSSNSVVGATVGGLRIVDIADPRAPRLLGSFGSIEADRVAVAGSRAFVADGESGLRVLDVADPAAPRQTGLATSFRPERVALAPGRAYALEGGVEPHLGGQARLVVVDAADPARPRVAGSVLTSGTLTDLVARGEYVYVSRFPQRGAGDAVHTNGGLLTFDARDAARPTIVSEYATPGDYNSQTNAAEVAVHGQTLYLLEQDATSTPGGLRIFDLADPARPAFVRFVEVRGARGLDVDGGRLYVSDFQGFRIFDLATPDQPREIGSLGDVRLVWGPLAVASGFVYLPHSLDATYGPQLVTVVDVRDPANPTRVAEYMSGWRSPRIDAVGAYGFVLTGTGLAAFQLAACAGTVATYDGPAGVRAADAAVDGANAYLAADAGGLHVVRLPSAVAAPACRRILLPFTHGQL